MIKLVDNNGGLLGCLLTKRMEAVLTADALYQETTLGEYLASVFCDNVSVSPAYVGIAHVEALIQDWEWANHSEAPILTLPEVGV